MALEVRGEGFMEGLQDGLKSGKFSSVRFCCCSIMLPCYCRGIGDGGFIKINFYLLGLIYILQLD